MLMRGLKVFYSFCNALGPFHIELQVSLFSRPYAYSFISFLGATLVPSFFYQYPVAWNWLTMFYLVDVLHPCEDN